MKHLLSLLLAVVYCLTCLAGVAPSTDAVVSSSIFADLGRKFAQLRAWNEYCLQSGQAERTVYYLRYVPGQDVEPGLGGCQLPYFYGLSGTSEQSPAWSDAHCAEVNTRLQAFNHDRQNPANPDGVQLYAFYIGAFQAAFKTQLTANLQNQPERPVLQQLAQAGDEQAHDRLQAIFDQIEWQRADIFGNLSGHYSVSYAIEVSYLNGENQPRLGFLSGASENGRTRDSRSARDRYRREMETLRDCSTGFGSSESLLNRVYSYLEYFSDPALQQYAADCSAEALALVNHLRTTAAQHFVLERCGHYAPDDDAWADILRIARLLDDMGRLYDEGYLQVAAPPESYNWHGRLEELIAFRRALEQYGAQVEGLYAALAEAVEQGDWYRTFLLLHYLPKPGGLTELPVDLRVGAIRTLALGPLLESNWWGDHEGMVVQLFESVPTNPDYIAEFLQGLKSEAGLLQDLLRRLNNWLGTDHREAFVQQLTRLARAQAEAAKIHTGLHVPLSEVHWYSALPAYRYDYAFLSDGRVQLEVKQCADIRIDPFRDNMPHCRWESLGLPPLDPFALVTVDRLDKVRVVGDVTTNLLEGQSWPEMPAIFVAYVIRQSQAEDQFEAVVTAVELAGLFSGAGEMAAALRLGARLRLMLAGYTLASDVAPIVVESDALEDYLSNNYEQGAQVYAWLRMLTAANAVLTAPASFVRWEDAARAVAAVEKMEDLGVPLATVEEQLRLSLGSLSGAELERLAKQLRRELESSPTGFVELQARRAELAVDVADLMGRHLRERYGLSEDLAGRLGGQEKVEELVRTQHELLERLDRAKWPPEAYEAYWSDLAGAPEVLEAMIERPELVRAWEVLYPNPSRAGLVYLYFFERMSVTISRKMILNAKLPEKYPNLSVEEITAIHHYTNQYYEALNAALRNGTLDQHLAAFEEILNNALDKLPSVAGITYRGTSIPESVILSKYKAAFDNNHGVITEEAFTSTSSNKEVAETFTDSDVKEGDVRVFFTIHGFTGKDVNGISKYGPTFVSEKAAELEVLYMSKSKFNVYQFKETVDDYGNRMFLITLIET